MNKNFSKFLSKYYIAIIIIMLSIISIFIIIGLVIKERYQCIPAGTPSPTIKLDHLKEYKLDTIVNANAMKLTTPGLYYDFENVSFNIPLKLDLRPKCPPVYDQGLQGTCTNNSNAFLYEYYCKNILKSDFVPSRFFMDYNVSLYDFSDADRVRSDIIIDTQSAFGGSRNLFNISALSIDGVCSEKNFPYPTYYFQDKYNNTKKYIHHLIIGLRNLIDKPELYNKTIKKIENLRESNMYPIPSRENYIEARHHRLKNVNIYRIKHDLVEMKKCLNLIGPICFDMKMTKHIMDLIKFGTTNKDKLEETKKNMYNKSMSIYKNVLSVTTNKNDISRLTYEMTNLPNILHLAGHRDHTKYKYLKFYTKETYEKLMDIKGSSIQEEVGARVFKLQNFTLKWPRKEIAQIRKTLPIVINENTKILRRNFNIDIDIAAIPNLKQNPNFKLLNEITGGDGGHSMAIVGYDDEKKIFIVRNSWSDKWGDKGYFYIDYEYFINRDPIFGFFIGDMFAIGKLN